VSGKFNLALIITGVNYAQNYLISYTNSDVTRYTNNFNVHKVSIHSVTPLHAVHREP